MWSSTPAIFGGGNTGYPVGNGMLGAMQFGNPGKEQILLNVDSMWSGGVKQFPEYRGGNPTSNMSEILAELREKIFLDGTGNASQMAGSSEGFGEYRILGNFSINIDHPGKFDDYKRSLDLETGTYRTSYRVDDSNYNTLLFCSHPSRVCVYRVSSTKPLPNVHVKFNDGLPESEQTSSSCGTQYSYLDGVMKPGQLRGMQFSAFARVAGTHARPCRCSKGTLTIRGRRKYQTLTLVFSADTNYESRKGNKAENYRFLEGKSAERVIYHTYNAIHLTMKKRVREQTKDYNANLNGFILDLPDHRNSSKAETATLFARYRAEGKGDPFVESLLFDYSRYLLLASSRKRSLPPSVQGRWIERMDRERGAEYSANIHLQANYWVAHQTGMDDTLHALWEFLKNTLATRGSETAKLLYNASGWVAHNELNIFGYTGIKGEAEWNNYPISAAWLMQHVWDHFEYTQDRTFLRTTGYPLMRDVSKFWLSQLQEDKYSKDGSLVANPCTSPEHGPTTFGCAHFQQLIHQILETTRRAMRHVKVCDKVFQSKLDTAISHLDKGLHLTSQGSIKEWRLPESEGHETDDKSQHLSHLVGWFPGYSIASFQDGYRNSTIQQAVKSSLESRGTGEENGNSGWAKAWRAACWARLNNTEQAYAHLRRLIQSNIAENGLSTSSGPDSPFQMSGNMALAGAILSMLVVDLPLPHSRIGEARTVVLGPAIPSMWAGGKVTGLMLRGGWKVDFSWDANGKVDKAELHGKGRGEVVLVNVDGVIMN
ncbi:hypothetical protein RJ55_02030 [Drechmeria coniospora]|nr:hypothetical protein RJ55_02030 [Drechmeria coniospora]